MSATEPEPEGLSLWRDHGGEAAGAPYWFNTGPLTELPDRVSDSPDSASNRFRQSWRSGSFKGRLDAVRGADLKGIAADWWSDARRGGRVLERFAEANGLDYEAQRYDRQWVEGEALPGMIFRDGERRDILSWGEPVSVEFGNWSAVGQELTLAFGYVAVRHDLGLPHLIFDARANDAEPPRGSGIYAKQHDYTSLSENYRGSDTASPLGRIRHTLEPLDLGSYADSYFQAYCDAGHAAEARAFLNKERLQMLRAASQEFDVEITHDWICLYARAIEISWPTAERWAWVFSIATRLWDHVESWHITGGMPPSTSPPPFYIGKTVPRPAEIAHLPKPSPGWQAFWDLGDPHM